jgi:hypothetical protein
MGGHTDSAGAVPRDMLHPADHTALTVAALVSQAAAPLVRGCKEWLEGKRRPLVLGGKERSQEGVGKERSQKVVDTGKSQVVGGKERPLEEADMGRLAYSADRAAAADHRGLPGKALRALGEEVGPDREGQKDPSQSRQPLGRLSICLLGPSFTEMVEAAPASILLCMRLFTALESFNCQHSMPLDEVKTQAKVSEGSFLSLRRSQNLLRVPSLCNGSGVGSLEWGGATGT